MMAPRCVGWPVNARPTGRNSISGCNCAALAGLETWARIVTSRELIQAPAGNTRMAGSRPPTCRKEVGGLGDGIGLGVAVGGTGVGLGLGVAVGGMRVGRGAAGTSLRVARGATVRASAFTCTDSGGIEAEACEPLC